MAAEEGRSTLIVHKILIIRRLVPPVLHDAGITCGCETTLDPFDGVPGMEARMELRVKRQLIHCGPTCVRAESDVVARVGVNPAACRQALVSVALLGATD